jgi:hypothetical protein
VWESDHTIAVVQGGVAGSGPRLNPVNIDLKNGAAAQKRSLDPNESQEAMPAEQMTQAEAERTLAPPQNPPPTNGRSMVTVSMDQGAQCVEDFAEERRR